MAKKVMRICRSFLKCYIRWPCLYVLFPESGSFPVGELGELPVDGIMPEISSEHPAKDITLGPSFDLAPGFYALSTCSTSEM